MLKEGFIMIYKNIELKKAYPVNGGALEVICIDNPWDEGHEDWRRPAVIVVPGGAYYLTSKREGMPVGSEFLARGFQVFILYYLCSKENVHYPEQLIELACSVDHVRKNAEEYHVNPEEVFVIGFSAGGHLVADLSNEYTNVSEKAGVMLDSKPTAVGLGYPVIDDHDGSFDNLLFGYDEKTAEKLKNELKLSRRVGKHTPPTFIWATADDKCVSVDNSLRYALSLSENDNPFELHVYQKGNHGVSNGSFEVNLYDPSLKILSAWVNDCARFFRSYCKEKF